ncbi:hypothetical protein [Thioclava sp. GXIMD4216]
MKLEALILFFSLLVAPIAHLTGARPDHAGLTLMVVPPWEDAVQVADVAQARLIGPTRAPFGLLIEIDDLAQLDRLERAGAWFLLDARKVEWICG